MSLAMSLAISMLVVAFPVAAFAAEPNNQACLGKDFSSYALAGGSSFGQFNAGLAQYVPGLGYPIQLHLAGWIPDSTVPNSCND
jgi:hypothetical protein